MSPQVKAAKDFDDTLSTKRRSPPPHQEPQHLPPPPPAPRLSLPALGSFTTPSSQQDTTPTTTTTTSSDYDDSYTAFYSSIPTVADSLYTAITPVTTTSTSTPSITTKATTANNYNNSSNNSNNPYLYHPYSTTFTGSIEYQYHASLGSRTPMQVVAMSNHKLNSDIFSSRSLSIHRRILVKNLLTLLYEMNPMLDWFDDASGLDVGMYDGDEEVGNEGGYSEPLLGEDEQNGWIEQTLSAAGLSDEDDDDDDYDDCDSSLVFDRMSKSKDLSVAKTSTATTSMINATQQQKQQKQQQQSKKSKKSKDGRGSSSSVGKKKDKKDDASVGSGMANQSTPNIKCSRIY
ncbi:hypothetical protein BGZ95_007438 [Linnemannia exigua]|uniref:Uncharacterized protein n=1 Tax=Linnemannia exigua TaxID=604196 RepID=A0AAD4DF29_9FUNG|nr:hypothetical protein BGZ95_007438 [Linnemannia exigua]